MITEAGNDEKVKALVYVAAFAPKAGETVGDQVKAHNQPPALAHIEDDGAGFLTLSAQGWITSIGQDLPESEARLLAIVQTPLATTTFGDRITTAAWQTRPSWYVVSTEDRAVSVDLQRELAHSLEANTTEIAASHMSLLSQPETVARVITDAVAATAK